MAVNKNKDYLYKDKIIQCGHIVIPSQDNLFSKPF